jgi:NAD-dependent dihydropyrimidine dehydrogenase PreA subunit
VSRRNLRQSPTWGVLGLNGWRGWVNLRTLHGYVYLRWQHWYAAFLLHRVNPVGGNRARRWLSQRYHGKVLAPELARRVIQLDREILSQDLERVIPYPMARQIVLTAPPRLVAYECACRQARAHPCQPTQVCLFVGDPIAAFMLEHHPQQARELGRAEALELLEAEHARGHVHTAWFKEALGERFYVLCNCCACCCAGIQMMKQYNVPFLAPSGYVARLEPSRCRGCGRCLEVCAFGALRLEARTLRVDAQVCMGCGVCADRCPAGALTLELEPRRGQPLCIDARPVLGGHPVCSA